MFDDDDDEQGNVAFPNTDRLLMSEELRGAVPELEGQVDALSRLANEMVTQNLIKVVIHRFFGEVEDSMLGVVQSFRLGVSPNEFAFTVGIDEAFKTIDRDGLSFGGFELHYGEMVKDVVGPFRVLNVIIQDIDPLKNLCTMHLIVERVEEPVTITG